jgi:RNA polymerase sigma factor (sigma-70 family)
MQTVNLNVADYLPLVKAISRKFYRGKERIEDTEIYSVGCQSLVECLPAYDQAKGTFDKFAYQAIKNGIIQFIRYNKRKKRNIAINSLSDYEWNNIKEVEETIEKAPEISSETISLLLKLDANTDQDKEDKKLLIDYYLNNMRISEISANLGVSKVTIYNRINRIIKKIKKQISA